MPTSTITPNRGALALNGAALVESCESELRNAGGTPVAVTTAEPNVAEGTTPGVDCAIAVLDSCAKPTDGGLKRKTE